MNIEITLTKEDLESLRAGKQVIKDVRGTIVCLEYNPPIDWDWEEKTVERTARIKRFLEE